jgi:hypothetical protein
MSQFPYPYTNLGKESGSVVVIRHGERSDEVSGHWHEDCKKRYRHCKKTFHSRVNDPPLTENGKLQAREVARTLKRELCNAQEMPRVIFSSKLIRSLMTAYEIAKELALPICVSRGFSLTAAAVKKHGKDFIFVSIEELQELCPGVDLIDGDCGIFDTPLEIEIESMAAAEMDIITNTDNVNVNVDNNTNSCSSSSRSSSSTPKRPRSLSDERRIYLPDQSWAHSLHFLSNWKYSLVVAHRESIRDLARQYLPVPYCCYAVFSYRTTTKENGSFITDLVRTPRLQSLYEASGVPIAFKKLEESDDEEVVDFI